MQRLPNYDFITSAVKRLWPTLSNYTFCISFAYQWLTIQRSLTSRTTINETLRRVPLDGDTRRLSQNYVPYIGADQCCIGAEKKALLGDQEVKESVECGISRYSPRCCDVCYSFILRVVFATSYVHLQVLRFVNVEKSHTDAGNARAQMNYANESIIFSSYVALWVFVYIQAWT